MEEEGTDTHGGGGEQHVGHQEPPTFLREVWGSEEKVLVQFWLEEERRTRAPAVCAIALSRKRRCLCQSALSWRTLAWRTARSLTSVCCPSVAFRAWQSAASAQSTRSVRGEAERVRSRRTRRHVRGAAECVCRQRARRSLRGEAHSECAIDARRCGLWRSGTSVNEVRVVPCVAKQSACATDARGVPCVAQRSKCARRSVRGQSGGAAWTRPGRAQGDSVR